MVRAKSLFWSQENTIMTWEIINNAEVMKTNMTGDAKAVKVAAVIEESPLSYCPKRRCVFKLHCCGASFRMPYLR